MKWNPLSLANNGHQDQRYTYKPPIKLMNQKERVCCYDIPDYHIIWLTGGVITQFLLLLLFLYSACALWPPTTTSNLHKMSLNLFNQFPAPSTLQLTTTPFNVRRLCRLLLCSLNPPPTLVCRNTTTTHPRLSWPTIDNETGRNPIKIGSKSVSATKTRLAFVLLGFRFSIRSPGCPYLFVN